jgi:hypothetical protein
LRSTRRVHTHPIYSPGNKAAPRRVSLAPKKELSDSLKRGLITGKGDGELVKRFETIFALREGSGVLSAA